MGVAAQALFHPVGIGGAGVTIVESGGEAEQVRQPDEIVMDASRRGLQTIEQTLATALGGIVCEDLDLVERGNAADDGQARAAQKGVVVNLGAQRLARGLGFCSEKLVDGGCGLAHINGLDIPERIDGGDLRTTRDDQRERTAESNHKRQVTHAVTISASKYRLWRNLRQVRLDSGHHYPTTHHAPSMSTSAGPKRALYVIFAHPAT